jgi:hypothetical protein
VCAHEIRHHVRVVHVERRRWCTEQREQDSREPLPAGLDVEVFAHLAGQFGRGQVRRQEVDAFAKQHCGILSEQQADRFFVEVLLGGYDPPCLRDEYRCAAALAMGRPDLPADHDAFDEAVAAWTRNQKPADVVAALRERGIPAEEVTTAEHMYDLPGRDVRGFYEEFDHAVTGRHRYPGWPLRISPGPARHHRFGTPTLGQHNNEILGGLGLSSDDLDALRHDQVIGERAMG